MDYRSRSRTLIIMTVTKEFGLKRCADLLAYMDEVIDKFRYGAIKPSRYLELYNSASGLYAWWDNFVHYLERNNLNEIEITQLEL